MRGVVEAPAEGDFADRVPGSTRVHQIAAAHFEPTRPDVLCGSGGLLPEQPMNVPNGHSEFTRHIALAQLRVGLYEPHDLVMYFVGRHVWMLLRR